MAMADSNNNRRRSGGSGAARKRRNALHPRVSELKIPKKWGVCAVAEFLTDYYHLVIGTDEAANTSKGIINTAFRYLQSSFAASIKPMKAIASSILGADATPVETNAINTPRIGRTSNIVTPSPDANISDNEPTSFQHIQPHRLDDILIESSISNLPPRRLKMEEILGMDISDSFVIFIPPTNKNSPLEFKKSTSDVMHALRRAILDGLPPSMPSSERDVYFKEELKHREVERGGRVGHEFNVRVLSYPEKQFLSRDSILDSEKKYHLNPHTGLGITVQIVGYGPSATTHLKLFDMPFIEFYVPRKSGECVYSNIKLPRTKNDEMLALFLARELSETKGDVIAYLAIIMQHYSAALKSAVAQIKVNENNHHTEVEQLKQLQSDGGVSLVARALDELTDERLRNFANEVDACYEVAFLSCYKFHEVCRYLISDETNNYFYNKLKAEFPTLHEILLRVVDIDDETQANDSAENKTILPKKQRMMLYVFYVCYDVPNYRTSMQVGIDESASRL